MQNYIVSEIYPSDKESMNKVSELLRKEGITLDANLDHTCAIFDDELNVIATGSCWKNTLRCLAVDSAYRGTGLMNEIVSYLMDLEFRRSFFHIFVYTKASAAKFFKDLGFYEISRVDGSMVFLENKKNGFGNYLSELSKSRCSGRCGAVVINANPFTSGHRYLIETASRACDKLHIFILSEDSSIFPFGVRKKLIMEGTSDIDNLIYHDSGSYIISSATFPSYFFKDKEDVIRNHARLDVDIFKKIAAEISISVRFAGAEPFSRSTSIYNQVMQEELSKSGIEFIQIPRGESFGMPISASSVRQLIHDGDMDKVKSLVPETTYRYLISDEASPVIAKIRHSSDLIHY